MTITKKKMKKDKDGIKMPQQLQANDPSGILEAIINVPAKLFTFLYFSSSKSRPSLNGYN